jgi:hypothetical protein
MQTTVDYNQQIGIHPQSLDNVEFLVPSGILIRLYKFERLSETESGLLNPDYQATFTKGERPDTQLNEQDYQYRGIVVRLTEGAKRELPQLSEDDNVWVASTVRDIRRAFYTDRQERVSQDNGYFIAFPGEIHAIEKN